jgi:hypothetical protein
MLTEGLRVRVLSEERNNGVGQVGYRRARTNKGQYVSLESGL